MKIIISFYLTVIIIQSFGQSITLLPANVATQNSENSHELQSNNESILRLKRTNPSGAFTGLSFYKHDNTLLGNLNFGSGFTIFSSKISNILFRVGNTNDDILRLSSNQALVNGYFEVTSLGFPAMQSSTELRTVYVNEDGLFKVSESQINSSFQYESYNFSSVQAQDYDDQLRKGSGYAWFNTTNISTTMYIPVNLPNGVKVTNVRMFLVDNSASNLSFTFNKNSHLSNTFTTIATAQSSTNNANIFSISNNANETIDNQNNSYYVNISSEGNWTGNTLKFHSLVITYYNQ